MSDKTIEQRLQELQQEVAKLKSKSAIQIWGNSYITLTNNNATKYNAFIEKIKIGEGLSLEAGDVKIGKGVNRIKVSGQCNINKVDTEGRKDIMIAKNDTEERAVFSYWYCDVFPNSKERTFSFPVTLVDVAEGDRISLYVKGASGDAFGANGNGQISILVEEA